MECSPSVNCIFVADRAIRFVRKHVGSRKKQSVAVEQLRMPSVLGSKRMKKSDGDEKRKKRSAAAGFQRR